MLTSLAMARHAMVTPTSIGKSREDGRVEGWRESDENIDDPSPRYHRVDLSLARFGRGIVENCV